MRQRKKFGCSGLLVLLALGCVGFAGWRLWQEPAAFRAAPPPPTTQAQNVNEHTVDFAALQKTSPDIVAWIQIQGTAVDYPVVQGKNNEYYLKKTPEGIDSKYGSIFLDYRSHADFSDYYSIIFGHNMKDDRMFGTLQRFKDADFFAQAKTGTLFTPAGVYQMQFFACIVTNAKSSYYKDLVYFAPAEKEQLLAKVQRDAKCWRDVQIGENDHIVLLSTCTYEFTEARTLVFAVIDSSST
ncbi:MAG: class B sortase [Oscillospiraceae bacterium]|jgi:sortase B|nr:class B sortase [Oscillospiraceae bacterium]